MNIGDRVRLKHGKEEGIIVKILPNNLIEVEIEDGFPIPVLAHEVVHIAHDERDYFKTTPVVQPDAYEKNQAKKVLANKGIYYCFVPLNAQKLTLYFINNTDFTLNYTVGLEHAGNYQGLTQGSLAAKQAQRINEFALTSIDKWGVFVTQALFFHSEGQSLQAPLQHRKVFNLQQFSLDTQMPPVLRQQGYVFQLDGEEELPQTGKKATTQPEENILGSLDLQKLKESMFENLAPTPEIKQQAELFAGVKVAVEVDLHIEKLVKNPSELTKDEILPVQVQIFEKQLELAISQGKQEIIFIHGVGNGVLKNTIQKLLSSHPSVDYYKDARKEKFGYGATHVKLK